MAGRFFSEERVNAGRQPELDLLKALCVLGMIMIHVFLDLGEKVLPTVLDDYTTVFFGASTFMICMGIGTGYMRSQSPKAYYIRGFGILTIGQFLNILRNSLFNLIAYWITGDQFFIANAFLILQSDILSFAGLAFLLLGLFKQLKIKTSAVLGISVAMSTAALVLWHLAPLQGSYLVRQLAAYFIITDAEAYFPLFCYFIFVAFGCFIGEYYPRIKDKNALANRVIAICLPLSALWLVPRFIFEMPWLPKLGGDLQYNLQPTPDAIAGCLFTLGFLAVLYKIVRAMGGRLPKVVLHFSRYINSYYCLSYLFILPLQTILIAVKGSVMSGKLLPVLYWIFVTAACYVLIELNEKYWHIHFVTLKGKKLAAFTAGVWIATVVIAAYAYPRIEEFANIWNEYLLP